MFIFAFFILLLFKFFFVCVCCYFLSISSITRRVACEGVKCLSSGKGKKKEEKGGRDRGREKRAAELIAPRHLFQPMLKNYSTVPPDTAFYPQKDHCQRLKINNRLPINTFPQISPDYKHIDDTSIGSLLVNISLSLSLSLSLCLSPQDVIQINNKKKHNYKNTMYCNYFQDYDHLHIVFFFLILTLNGNIDGVTMSYIFFLELFIQVAAVLCLY